MTASQAAHDNVVHPQFPLSSRSADHVWDGGYIRLLRREFTEGDSVFGTDRIRIGAWIEMLARAAWKPVDVRRGETWITLQRGQLVINYREWGAAWGLQTGAFYHACKRMEKHGRIRLETRRVDNGAERVVTVVTISNYDLYNPPVTQKAPEQDAKSQNGENAGVSELDQKAYEQDANNKNPKEGKERKRVATPESRTNYELPYEPLDPTPALAVASAPAGDSRGTRLPKGWQPSPKLLEYAAAHDVPRHHLPRMVDDFCCHWHAKAGAAARKADWDLTFMTWARREGDRWREKAERDRRNPKAHADTKSRY